MGFRTTSHPWMAALLAAWLFALASCQSTLLGSGPPWLPVSVSGEHCRVHARTRVRANEVVQAVDAAFEFLKVLPAARRHEFVDVYVREGERDAWTDRKSVV